jgi:outer membrane receptor protein involved in Fe transport
VTLASDLGNYGWKAPGAKSGVGIAVGVERRVEKLLLDVDSEFDTGDLAGQGGPTHGVNGQYTVKEVFGEVRVPLMEGRRGADLLAVNASYRRSEYSTDVSTDTYGFGAEYAPMRMLKVRGSYQVAVRAANVIELFTPQGLGLFNTAAGDPCGPSRSASLAACQRSGVTAAQYGAQILESPAGQYNQLFGGNPALTPEKAKTQTVGVVLQPMRNLSATLDWFHIKVDDLIVTGIDPNVVLQQCLTTGNLCNLIHRDNLGTLWLLSSGFISGTNTNIGGLKTSGFDVSVNYTHPIGAWGSLGLNFSGTYLKELVTDNGPGLGQYDCVKYYGGACGTPNPEWRHRLRVTWSTPWNFDGALTWRHFDSVKHSGLSSNPLLSTSVNSLDQELGKRDYIDLAASWAFSKQITVRGGVNNVFDKDPPVSALVGAGFGNGNTFPQVYDALGRKIFMAVVVKW